ncbi:MAG: universal stress protein [Deltaproteobacteria bacterium]|nr:universal stress protein [Deltaproteobacteria bacterium]
MQASSRLLTRILLPYDNSPSARNALRLAAALSDICGEAIQALTLLRVISGSYLARHLHNVDLRVTRLNQTKAWQKIRARYMEEEIKPMLLEAQDILGRYGVGAPIELKIVEGKIGEQILAIAHDEKYSAIIMGRRGLSPLQELLLGSATSYVLARAAGVTVFIVGAEAAGAPDRLIFPLLLPVDGSETSLEAVRQAAVLAQTCTITEPRLILLSVVDLALLGQLLPEESRRLVEEGHNALAAARQILNQAGLGEYTREKLVNGIPAPVIAEVAEKEQCALIFMGSVGHSALSRFLMGSVTAALLQLVQKPTVAVVYPSEEISLN